MENIIIYYYYNFNIKLGDKISVSGKLEEINENTNFNLFNYKKFLLSKNIHYKMIGKSIKIVNKNNNIFLILKNIIKRRTLKNAYLSAFILGDSTFINKELKETYMKNNIVHLFAISGMHITLLTSIILFILNSIRRTKFNYIIVILFLILYMFLANFSSSVVRSTLLFIILFINKFLDLKLNKLRILLIVLCVVLIINPYNIYNIGFKFSYIISFYLILFNKIITRNNNYLKKILVTSCISFLASIPILINNYYSINLLSIINNLIFVPFVSIILFPLSILVLLIPKLEIIYDMFIIILEQASLFIYNFKIEIVLCKTNIIVILVYYLAISLILYKISRKKYLYIFIIIIMIFIHSHIKYIKNNPYITFLDVGQGDSIFIHMPYDKGNILIDTGGNINYDISSNIINYLKSEGVTRIDYLILSHGDFDHIGAAINLIDKFEILNVIFNAGQYNTLELNIIKTLNEKKISYFKNINSLNISKNKLHFLHNKEYNNENGNSIVIYFNYNGIKSLFMGDAGIYNEKEILDKYKLNAIDILKVGHHGSSTSSSEAFINNIKPKTCLISVGKNNIYGHPKEVVLDTLKDCNIYRTDKNGSIKIELNKKYYKITTVN